MLLLPKNKCFLAPRTVANYFKMEFNKGTKKIKASSIRSLNC